MSGTTPQNPWEDFELGLVTIELETPFVVSTAEGDNLFDAVFVTDANGLPCIPGESMAGILRHAVADGGDPEKNKTCREVFGWQDRDRGDASRVRVSFSHVHDSNDRPVPFRGAKTDDAVLAFLTAGVGRDHVRIGPHGAVDARGKFDELLVPAGARFTFELSVSRRSPCRLGDLAALLNRTDVRIGRSTRRGLGKLKVVRVKAADFDLRNASHVDLLGRLPVAIDKASSSDILKPITIPKATSGQEWIHGTLSLRPIGTWMMGGGMATGREPKRANDGAWDRVSVSERRILWTTDGKTPRGSVMADDQAPYLVPGSSVKGSLRHRTGFHARRLAEQWADGSSKVPAASDETLLFGETRDSDKTSAGRVQISDAFLDPSIPLVPLQHVSLDRFTQGPMDHLLFDEVALGDCTVRLEISVRIDAAVTVVARRSLAAALDDLCEGRLAIGAGRGHGRFRGQIDWTEGATLHKELANVGHS